MGRPRKQEIELTGTERASLSDLVRSRSAPQGLVRRARIVLASAVGASNTAIAREVGHLDPGGRALAQAVPRARSGGALWRAAAGPAARP